MRVEDVIIAICHIDMDLEGSFFARTREEIDADAAHVDLRSRCPYFYELGYKIAPLWVFLYLILHISYYIFII